MEGLEYRNSRLDSCCIIIIIICIFLAIQLTCAQEDFQSIQCCSDSNYTDPNTNITWTRDAYWFPKKQGCQDIARAVVSDTSYNKTRFFSSAYSTKWCYNLTTKKDQKYLIRSTHYGDLQRTPPGMFFHVLIGVTPVGKVKASNYAEVEGIFKATDDYMNFCLSQGKGEPYISKLELRPLDADYLNTEPTSALKLVHRVDVGSTGEEIRYPHDPYDRIWRPESNSSQISNVTSVYSENVTVTNSTVTLPPIEVLQTAVTHPERLEFLHEDLETGIHKYNLYLYFLELNNTVQAGQRVFDIFINNEKQQEIDILAGGSNYSMVILNFTTNGFLNMTMIKTSNGSQLGPICNGYEILHVHPWFQLTAQEDVDAIVDVKNELLEANQENEALMSWSGDPCLPHSWHGLYCELLNSSSVISKLDLSKAKLQGSIPPSITNLVHLKEMNLSHNDFTNNIPTFPASSILTSVDLRHNDLMGRIPESLTSLAYLTSLYYGCNSHFSKELPASHNLSKLATDYGMCGGQAPPHSPRGVVIGTIAGILFLTIAVAIGICFFKQKLIARGKLNLKGRSMTKNAVYAIPSSTNEISLKSISIQSFTLEQIESAIQRYKTLIGEGGFGSVYRGTLPDGQEVAVKVRSATSTQGTREFDNELTLLSAIRHENLVPLLGYCCENEQQILVYPFMSNGSLQDRLYGDSSKRRALDWPTRLSIALGAARGLTYLHTFSGRSVIHRDVKSSNILLDHSMCAKVADFGFSKYAPQEGDSGASLEVRGTAGYLDPEYYSTQHLSAKSDVFSFGVVLLEIISGREPLNIHRPRNEWSLVEWAKPYIRNSRMDEIVDPSIKGGYHAEAMWRVVEVALACIEPYSAYRPCMVDIVRELEDALIIENNASEYMRSIDSFGGSNRFSIERPIVIAPTPTPTEPSPLLLQPAPPQPR